jgi:LacI family transcriptional regulator
MNKAPTIHDLAADLKISATTVWRALNNHNRISTATRERVLARAKAINYVPSQVAQNLSHGRTQTLGIIVPMISHPIFSTLIEKIEEAAFHRGYNLIVCDARLDIKREIEYAQMLLRRRVEGIIVVPFAERSGKWDRHLVELQKRQVPVVLLEQDLPTNRFDRVVADNFGAAYDMTRHLIKLGHRRLAFAFHPVHDWDAVGKERLSGFNHAVNDAGLGNKATRLLDVFTFGGDQVWRYQSEKIVECFSRTGHPTALFAAMDMLAIRAMETLREIGLKIPDDVAVAGFDNIEFSRFTRPALTTVMQPAEEMGRRAAEILFNRIEFKAQAPKKAKCERLPCHLVIRQSCGSTSNPKQHENYRSNFPRYHQHS